MEILRAAMVLCTVLGSSLVACVDPQCPKGWSREGDECAPPDAGIRVDGSVEAAAVADGGDFGASFDGSAIAADAAVGVDAMDATGRAATEDEPIDRAVDAAAVVDAGVVGSTEAGPADASAAPGPPDTGVSSCVPSVPPTEVCNDKDDDCDGSKDNGAKNACGMPCGSTCPPPPPVCTPAAEVCDQKDNDCDRQVDEDGACPPACVPTAEICDRIDNDCDGQIDEEAPTWYRDCDNDGAAVLAGGIRSCIRPEEPGCPSWLDKAPAVSDCNDADPSYRPGIVPVLSSNGPNANEEKKYIGDMNCDGIAEKPEVWQYYDASRGWVDTSVPLCSPSVSICEQGARCYTNDERPGMLLGCGNTEIKIVDPSSCSVIVVDARVACR
jgi:hypothetical protein